MLKIYLQASLLSAAGDRAGGQAACGHNAGAPDAGGRGDRSPTAGPAMPGARCG